MKERHASLRQSLPRRRNPPWMQAVMIVWYRGASVPAPSSTRQHTWGHESFQVQKASVDTKSLWACRVTRESSESSRASPRQALLVKLRWSLVFGPCVCCERLSGDDMGGRRWRCFSANHGTRVPGHHGSLEGCAFLGLAPVSALEGSAQCFTICTSRRARRLNFGGRLP